MTSARTKAGPRRRPGLLVLVVLALTAISARAQVGPDADPTDLVDRVRAILGDLRGDPPRSPQETVTRLASFGTEIAPVLLSVRDEFGDAVHVAVIADTLARLSSDKLEGYLVWVITSAAEVPVRVVAHVKLAEYGGALALPHCLTLFEKHDPQEKRVAERALASMLARLDDDRSFDSVARFIRSAPSDVQMRLVSCVASAGSKRGLRVLADLLGRGADLDLVIVSGMSRLPVTAEDEDIVSRLLDLMRSENTNLRRECALALGVFRIASAVEALIDLLEDDDRGVRSNALWSLRRISGLTLPGDPRAWKMWFEREWEWWRAEGERFLDLLDSEDEGEVLNAIAMLSVRSLFREQFAPRLESLLESDSELVREAARAVLAGERSGLSGSSGGSGNTGLLAGRKLVRPPSVAPASTEVEEAVEEPSGGGVVYVVLGFLILLFALYVFGVIHPDQVRNWLRSRAS